MTTTPTRPEIPAPAPGLSTESYLDWLRREICGYTIELYQDGPLVGDGWDVHIEFTDYWDNTTSWSACGHLPAALHDICSQVAKWQPAQGETP